MALNPTFASFVITNIPSTASSSSSDDATTPDTPPVDSIPLTTFSVLLSPTKLTDDVRVTVDSSAKCGPLEREMVVILNSEYLTA